MYLTLHLLVKHLSFQRLSVISTRGSHYRSYPSFLDIATRFNLLVFYGTTVTGVPTLT